LGLVVKFTVKEGHEEAFDDLVSGTLPRIRDREPGTLIYACHRVPDSPRTRLFYELYQDKAAFDAHEQQPHVRRFLTEREQHLEGAAVDRLTLVDGKGLPASDS
jgi:quinol monooxygenase YgiN